MNTPKIEKYLTRAAGAPVQVDVGTCIVLYAGSARDCVRAAEAFLEIARRTDPNVRTLHYGFDPYEESGRLHYAVVRVDWAALATAGEVAS